MCDIKDPENFSKCFTFFFPDSMFQPKGFNPTLKKITFNQLRPIIFALPLSLNRQTLMDSSTVIGRQVSALLLHIPQYKPMCAELETTLL